MIFLDSCDVIRIKELSSIGVIHGVTTNPTIQAKAHVTNKLENWQYILTAVPHLPVSLQPTTKLDLESVLAWSYGNIVVKIPIHSVDDYSDNLTVIHKLTVKVNVTACMSAQQALLGAYAGANYVSLFCGRIANMGHDPMAELELLRNLIDREGLSTKIIAGSVREVANVTEWLLAGAHIVTVPPEILEKMLVHPGTKEVVAQFLKDAEGLK